MNELAARMKYADRFTPIAASQIVARWVRRDNLAHPKIHKPRKVDSRKNATSASIANGAPNTSPTNREYSLQFIPNWNSCTCLLYTSDAADEEDSVDLGGRRI